MSSPKAAAEAGFEEFLENLASWDPSAPEEREYLNLQRAYVRAQISALKLALPLAREYEKARRAYAAALERCEAVIHSNVAEGFGDIGDFVEAEEEQAPDDSGDVEACEGNVAALQWRLRAYEETERLLSGLRR